jgi:predicted TIM-barrel fold metal-dependent hydrolase
VINDAHVHVGPSAPWVPEVNPARTIEDYVKAMEKYGIEKAIIFPNPGVGEGYAKQNDVIAEAQNKYPSQIIGFGRTDPRLAEGAIKEVYRFVNKLGLKGVKLHPIVECFRPDHPAFDPFFKAIEDLGVPILFHSSPGFFAEPHLIAVVAERHPKLKICLGHLYGSMLPVMEKNKNLWVETSGVSLPATIASAAKIAPDRVMYGSDWPYLNPRVEFVKVEEGIEDARIQRKVLTENFNGFVKGL